MIDGPRPLRRRLRGGGRGDGVGARRSRAAPAPDACSSSRHSGAQAGVVLNPATPVGALEDIAADVDYVLVMSVNPGFAGQTFIPRSESKVRAVREVLDRGRLICAASKSMAASTSRTWRASSPLAYRSSSPGSGLRKPDLERATRASCKAAAARGLSRRFRSSMSAPPPFSRVRVRYAETDQHGRRLLRQLPRLVRDRPHGVASRQTGWSYREMEQDGTRPSRHRRGVRIHGVREVRRRSSGPHERRHPVRRCESNSATTSCVWPTRAGCVRATPCTRRSIATGRPAGFPSACAHCFHEGSHYRRRRIHRIDARRATVGRRRGRRRHRLFYRLLSAPGQGARTCRRPAPISGSASSSRACRTWTCPRCWPMARTSSILRRRRA